MKKDQKIEAMVSYLLLKVDERDWHAVSDAANDLRVLEAKGERNGLYEKTKTQSEKTVAQHRAQKQDASSRCHRMGGFCGCSASKRQSCKVPFREGVQKARVRSFHETGAEGQAQEEIENKASCDC